MSDQPQSGLGPERAFVRLPTGEIRGVNQLLVEQAKQEAEISFATLRNGDVVVFEYGDHEKTGTFSFEVDEARWDELGIGGSWSPKPRITGRVSSDEDQIKPVVDKDVVLMGSGWGGSMMSPIIGTGRSIYFAIPKEGEFRTPFVNLFDVKHRDQDGKLVPYSPNQLDRRSETTIADHRKRLTQTEDLMRSFGFGDENFRDGQPPADSTHRTYDDGRYIAAFYKGGAMGNALAVLDRQTGVWFEAKYFAFKGEDFLQLALADLSGKDLDTVFYAPDAITSESSIHASNSRITTLTTSERYGMEVLNYKLGQDETVQAFGDQAQGVPASPDIQIWQDGRVVVPRTVSLLWTEDENPGYVERIRSSVSSSTDANGDIELNVNGLRLKMEKPQVYLDHLSAKFKEQGQ